MLLESFDKFILDLVAQAIHADIDRSFPEDDRCQNNLGRVFNAPDVVDQPGRCEDIGSTCLSRTERRVMVAVDQEKRDADGGIDGI
jgi:hypothetical protein